MDENVIIFILWLPESYGTINRNEMNKMQKNQMINHTREYSQVKSRNPGFQRKVFV